MKQWLIIAVLMTALLVYMGFQQESVSRLKDKYERMHENIVLLNGDIKQYVVRDSLHGAEVRALNLRIKDYERIVEDDARLIAELQSSKRDIESVLNANMQQLIELSTRPIDTLIIRDSVPMTAKHISIREKWYDLDGIMTNDDFRADLSVRDSLVAVELVEYRRFLGFLWKTKRVADRYFDIVSKNPYTEIVGLNFVQIEK